MDLRGRVGGRAEPLAASRRVSDGRLVVTAAAWSLALLAAFLQWGGPACLPWSGHRGGDPRVAAAHVAAAALSGAALGTWLPDPAAGVIAFAATVAGSWSAKALRSR